MKNLICLQYESVIEHRNQLLRYFKTRLTRKSMMTFAMGLMIFVIFYQILFSKIFGLSLNPNERVYYFSDGKSSLNSFNQTNILKDKAQGPATCLIIIRSADGAIGNRMFLFASAYGVARLHQCQLYVAPWILNDLRSVFRIEINQTKVQLTTDDSLVVNRTDIYGRYSACTLYSDLFRVPFNTSFQRYEMVGFYQAFGYFEKYREEVKYLFQFNSVAIERNVPVVATLLKGLINHILRFYPLDVLCFSCVESLVRFRKLYKG